LYSNFGLLYPVGHNELSAAEDFDQIRAAMEKVPAYASIFNKVGGLTATLLHASAQHVQVTKVCTQCAQGSVILYPAFTAWVWGVTNAGQAAVRGGGPPLRLHL
jgi:hypothetical protein